MNGWEGGDMTFNEFKLPECVIKNERSYETPLTLEFRNALMELVEEE